MMRGMVFPLWLLITILLVIGCHQPTPEKPVRSVKAVRVGDPSVLGRRWFPGRARATQEVNLSFQVNGRLISFPVKVGDVIKQGQLLARIDPRDFDLKLLSAESTLKQAQANLKAMKTGARPEEVVQLKASLRKAEADLRTAQNEFDRDERLYATKAVSAAELDRAARRLDSARAAYDKAKESLRIGEKGARKEDLEAKEAEIRSLETAVGDARNRLDYTYLRAPFDGEVAAIFVENFQNVQVKEPILRLLDISHIEMTVDIPESLINLAPQVKKAVVRFNAFQKREFPATIKEIGTEASQATGTFPVTLILKQPQDRRILPGMTGEAQARDRTVSAAGEIEVPLAAVFSPQDGGKATFVWVLDPDKKTVSRREVTIGEVATLGVKVLKGLNPGEWVVAAGVHELEEGQQVELLK